PKSPLPLRQRARLHSLLVCELRGGQAAVLPSLDDLDPLTSGTGRCPLAFFRHRQALAGVPPTVNDVLGGTGTLMTHEPRRPPDASAAPRRGRAAAGADAARGRPRDRRSLRSWRGS